MQAKTTSGSVLNVKAKRAVVLTCGGFEYGETMKRDFLPAESIFAFGDPGNTGDGIRMAQKAGAALWHMKAIACPLGFKFPEYDSAFQIGMPTPGYICVDRYGQRYMSEYADRYSMWTYTCLFDPMAVEYPRIPSYFIFDEDMRRKGPISRQGHGFVGDLYRWSDDNMAEIERGWIHQAPTLTKLAQKIGLPARGLRATVARYNRMCQNGADTDFHRPQSSLVPIRQPPLYAVAVWPSLLNTQGGPKRNARAQIVDPWDRPIPRLYSAGELGSIWGFMYQSGGNLGECLAFGRLAGTNAAKEAPWS